MFQNWSIKKIFTIFGLLLLIVASLQIYMFLTTQSVITHFILSFVALFIALILFHSINIKLKKKK
jgi:hypothetical protein